MQCVANIVSRAEGRDPAETWKDLTILARGGKAC
jgi:hypothetical protein